MKKRQIGTVKPGRIPVLDLDKNVRGSVGRTATQATVAKFLGHHNAKLGEHDGRLCWLSQGMPKGG